MKRDIDEIMETIKGIVLVIGFIIFFIIFIYKIVVIEPENHARFVKERIAKEKDLIRHGIHSIAIVTNKDWKSTHERSGGWSSVKKVYVNNKPINPDSLYMKDKFIYKYCGRYYILYDRSYRINLYYNPCEGIDSIVFYFADICFKEIYDTRGRIKQRLTPAFFKNSNMNELKDRLPKCK